MSILFNHYVVYERCLLMCVLVFDIPDHLYHRQGTRKAKPNEKRTRSGYARHADQRRALRWMRSRVPSSWWRKRTIHPVPRWVVILLGRQRNATRAIILVIVDCLAKGRFLFIERQLQSQRLDQFIGTVSVIHNHKLGWDTESIAARIERAKLYLILFLLFGHVFECVLYEWVFIMLRVLKLFLLQAVGFWEYDASLKGRFFCFGLRDFWIYF